jgi:hypothetical protein
LVALAELLLKFDGHVFTAYLQRATTIPAQVRSSRSDQDAGVLSGIRNQRGDRVVVDAECCVRRCTGGAGTGLAHLARYKIDDADTSTRFAPIETDISEPATPWCGDADEGRKSRPFIERWREATNSQLISGAEQVYRLSAHDKQLPSIICHSNSGVRPCHFESCNIGECATVESGDRHAPKIAKGRRVQRVNLAIRRAMKVQDT